MKNIFLKLYQNIKILTIEEHNLVNGLSTIVKRCVLTTVLPETYFNLGINDVLSSKVGDQNILDPVLD